MAKVRWLIMKSKPGELEEKALQVYSDKFSEYDKVSNLVSWLNRYSPNWNYWTKEIVE